MKNAIYLKHWQHPLKTNSKLIKETKKSYSMHHG